MSDFTNSCVKPVNIQQSSRKNKTNLFVELSYLFTHINCWDQLIGNVLQLAISHLHADCGWFSAYDDKSGLMRIKHLYNISPDIIKDISAVLSTGSLTGGAIIINDLRKYFTQEKRGFPTALICYPFYSDNTFLGSLFLCRKRKRYFSVKDKKELEALSFYSEKLVENAILIDNLKQNRDAMNELIDKIRLLEKMKNHLSKFVPASVLKLIEESPENPRLSQTTQDVSVLFLDIEGYTNINQILEPHKVNYLVETYFSSFLDDIYRNNGDINETAGDGLMILFLDNRIKSSAIKAVRTAISIKEKIQALEKNMAEPAIPMNINIGIHSGPALVGSVRFSGRTGDRWTFTASGMTTNITSRITKFAKNGEILISSDTANLVKPEYNMMEVGWKKLKDIEDPLFLYKINA